jgi:predicted nucleic acid-binding protein
MYLIDTDVVSELRKGAKTNSGVMHFFAEAGKLNQAMYISVVTVGELRRGVEIIRHRKDLLQAKRLETWLEQLLNEYEDHILGFGREEAEVWGRLRVPHPENALDKQIAATAFTHDLSVVTRNAAHFKKLGLPVVDPFD